MEMDWEHAGNDAAIRVTIVAVANSWIRWAVAVDVNEVPFAWFPMQYGSTESEYVQDWQEAGKILAARTAEEG